MPLPERKVPAVDGRQALPVRRHDARLLLRAARPHGGGGHTVREGTAQRAGAGGVGVVLLLVLVLLVLWLLSGGAPPGSDAG